MHKRHIIFALCLVFFLGLFFQYNRTDGFISLLKNSNAVMAIGTINEQPAIEMNLDNKHYLLVFDAKDINSILLKRNIERVLKYHKKKVTTVDSNVFADSHLPYAGIIMALGNFDQVKSMAAFRDFVRQGGSLYVMVTPKLGPAFATMYQEMGFDSIAEPGLTHGIKVLSNVLVKGKGFILSDNNYEMAILKGVTNRDAHVHLTSLENTPLLWDYSCGKGKYIVYNATGLQVKALRGIVAGMLSLGRDTYIYPVIGTKTVYIDDFPAPVPGGYSDVIQAEYQLSTTDFYRQVWWPDMLKLAERYNIRYTGLIIETYNNQVKPPFLPEEDHDANNKKNLVIYGRELLKSGGELGMHGYNHQPLTLQQYTGSEIDLGYNSWGSIDHMSHSIAELKRYVAEVYPGYKLKAYVPPSNILSKEGRKSLIDASPDLSIIASLYLPGQGQSTYVQEYTKSNDGIYEMPRISYDYVRDNYYDWEILNGVSSLGVFSHFIHPDNILYDEKANELGWSKIYKEFTSLIKGIQDNYGWLRSCTASEAAIHLDDYLNLEYQLEEKPDSLTLHCWGFRNEVYFILKTSKKINTVQGCLIENIDENTYLLKISAPKVQVFFESVGAS